MSHSFSIAIPDNKEVADVFKDAYLKIREADGFIDGDTKSGSFSAKGVEGTYSVFNNRIDITLRKKPFIVTYKFIEKKVTEYFK